MNNLLCAFFAAVVGFVTVSVPSAHAEDSLKIEFKQLRGTKPQSPLVVQEAELTPVAIKQAERIFEEGGMLDIPSFNQENTAGLNSCIYEFKISSHGKLHTATIDDKAAPAAYTKLIRFVLKHGHKPAEPLAAANATSTTTANATATASVAAATASSTKGD